MTDRYPGYMLGAAYKHREPWYRTQSYWEMFPEEPAPAGKAASCRRASQALVQKLGVEPVNGSPSRRLGD